MNNIKAMTIFGTRPEAAKMAPLVKQLEKSKYIDSLVCVSAQHRQMLDQTLDSFNITPNYDLNIMKQSQSLIDITTNILTHLDPILKKEQPSIVLVHGDTSTTFASALAAFYNQIPIGHVEAGLRTHYRYSPYPEEMNRKLVGSLATLHFAPTMTAKNNLLAEGINEDAIYITGNTIIDCILQTTAKPTKFKASQLNDLDYVNKKIIVITAHRRENLGGPLENICHAALEIAKKFDDVHIVYPVHFNPTVRATVFSILNNQHNIHLIEPLDMEDMHHLMKNAYIILTDSGGIQEEAPALNKPVIVLRDVSERMEGVETGALKLAGTNKQSIIDTTINILENKELYKKMATAKNPFGDGFASKRITTAIEHYFGAGNTD